MITLGYRESAVELLRKIEKPTRDHILLLNAIENCTPTILEELKAEIKTSPRKNKTDLWWLACCLELVSEDHKETFAEDSQYLAEWRKRVVSSGTP